MANALPTRTSPLLLMVRLPVLAARAALGPHAHALRRGDDPDLPRSHGTEGRTVDGIGRRLWISDTNALGGVRRAVAAHDKFCVRGFRYPLPPRHQVDPSRRSEVGAQGPSRTTVSATMSMRPAVPSKPEASTHTRPERTSNASALDCIERRSTAARGKELGNAGRKRDPRRVDEAATAARHSVRVGDDDSCRSSEHFQDAVQDGRAAAARTVTSFRIRLALRPARLALAPTAPPRRVPPPERLLLRIRPTESTLNC
ncbi:MAG: hypothetical protein MZW92_13615 [Comamonadaceae bacterium]|nr:hypothetical protein [Comamonadaceae bacterium]